MTPEYIIIARVECEACHGNGYQIGVSGSCPQCGGGGEVRYEISLLDALTELGKYPDTRQQIQRAIGIQ